jgi:adenylate cyclase class 2
MKDIEVELKFPLLNRDELIQKLKLIAKLMKDNFFQKDTYYNLPHRNFLDKTLVTEWLRIRETEHGCSLDYKDWHIEGGKVGVSCDEFEIEIKNAEKLKKIFEHLDFREIIIVEKTRSTWRYKDTIISVDDVKGLGTFIEIEAHGDFASIEEAKKHIYTIAKELHANLGEQDFEGYPHKLLRNKGFV